MLKRAVDATLNVDILSDTTTFRVKTGILWPNVVSLRFNSLNRVAPDDDDDDLLARVSL